LSYSFLPSSSQRDHICGFVHLFWEDLVMSDYTLFAAASGDEIQCQQTNSASVADADDHATEESETAVDPLFGTNSGDDL
jgi:hypothetical protein